MIINLSSLTNKGKFNLKWQGEYCFGETWIAFRGMSAENNLHAHAALQLVAGAGITVTDDNTFEKQGNGWLIPSGVKHRITTSSPIVILLIEPDSFFCRRSATLSAKRFNSTKPLSGNVRHVVSGYSFA